MSINFIKFLIIRRKWILQSKLFEIFKKIRYKFRIVVRCSYCFCTRKKNSTFFKIRNQSIFKIQNCWKHFFWKLKLRYATMKKKVFNLKYLFNIFKKAPWGEEKLTSKFVCFFFSLVIICMLTEKKFFNCCRKNATEFSLYK